MLIGVHRLSEMSAEDIALGLLRLQKVEQGEDPRSALVPKIASEHQ